MNWKRGVGGTSSSDVTDWAKFAALVAGVAFPPARIAALGIAGFEVTKRAIEAWGRASQTVDIHLVSQSEAKALVFAPGHPKTDVLYVGHPCIEDQYCTASGLPSPRLPSTSFPKRSRC